MNEESFILPSGDARLLAVWHGAGGAACRGALVVCHPLFEEKKAAHRPLVEMAREAARRGFHVLRLDCEGCGDSSGDLGAVTIESWLRDIGTGLDFAASRAGSRPVGLLGLRFGATLACLAAERRADVRFLALWEPVLNGRGYLMGDYRKKQVREMMTFGAAKTGRGSFRDALRAEGALDYDGFAVNAALFDSIAAVELAAGLKAFRGWLFTASVGAAVPPPVARFCGSLPPERVTTVSLDLPPYWNTVGIVDCGRLVEATAAWMEAKVG